MDKQEKAELEKDLIESINAGKVGTVRRLLKEGIEVDCIDHTGMTPLQHACYKGNLEICRLLLEHGANINDNRHHHGYTALMFAALSGNIQVVRFALEKGADASLMNSVKKTAAQMASFVGRHEIASTINNFISFEELSKYCNIKGKDGEALLNQQLLNSLHQYILTPNFNPVHLALVLKQHAELLQHRDAVCRVLEEMVEGLMKRKETDEVAAIKLHYFSSYLQQAASYMGLNQHNKAVCQGSGDYQNGVGEDGDGGAVDWDAAFHKWLKYLMQHKSPLDNPLPNQELVIRRSLLSFPVQQSQLFQQIVSTVTFTGKKGGGDNDAGAIVGLSAMSCLFNALNGQRMKNEEEDKQCAACDEFGGKACNICRSVHYCDKECQKLHWGIHKVLCSQMKERKNRMDRLKEEEEKKRLEAERMNQKNKKDGMESGGEKESKEERDGDDEKNEVIKEKEEEEAVKEVRSVHTDGGEDAANAGDVLNVDQINLSVDHTAE